MVRMARALLLLVAAALCADGVRAAVSLAPLQPKPDKFQHSNGCYLRELDDVIAVGSTAPLPGGCTGVICGTQHLQYVTCGAVAAGRGATVVRDMSAPYPACCPRVIPARP